MYVSSYVQYSSCEILPFSNCLNFLMLLSYNNIFATCKLVLSALVHLEGDLDDPGGDGPGPQHVHL